MAYILSMLVQVYINETQTFKIYPYSLSLMQCYYR